MEGSHVHQIRKVGSHRRHFHSRIAVDRMLQQLHRTQLSLPCRIHVDPGDAGADYRLARFAQPDGISCASLIHCTIVNAGAVQPYGNVNGRHSHRCGGLCR